MTVTLGAARDNTLYQDAQGDVSNGQGPDIFAGTDQAGTIRRALIRFNLNTIPPGSTITGATLRLRLNRTRGNTFSVTSHRVLADWGEGPSAALSSTGMGAPATYGDATWLHRFYDAFFWTTPGGDFVAASSASTTIAGTLTFYSWSGVGMVGNVQGWLSAPATNFGWIVRSNEIEIASAKRFDSSEATLVANRPQLVVTFTPPNSPTGACCLGGGGCTVLTRFYCDIQGGAYIGDSAACAPSPCGQTTIEFAPEKDNTLYEDAAGSISNGAGDGFIAGLGSDSAQRRRGLLAFDLSSVPAAARLLDASLRLTQTLTDDVLQRVVSLHRVNAQWGEGASTAQGQQTSGAPAETGDATWLHRFFASSFWGASGGGGDFDPAPSATATAGVGTGARTWTGAQLRADVQGWLATPVSNRGWAVLGDEGTPGSQRRFASREFADPATRPKLTVTYTLVPASAACCFAEGACAVLTESACATQGGVFDAQSALCAPNPCPQPFGACCLPLGVCVQLTVADCTAQQGNFLGGSAACAGVVCPTILEPFVDALTVPPIAQPVSGVPGGAAHYDMPMIEFTKTLHRDLPPTRLWGYGGTFPGPTIEAHTDQPVTVNWINDLRVLETGELRSGHVLSVDECLHGPEMSGGVPVTVVHLHGAKTTTDSDGHPDLTFPPGQQSDLYTYPNGQRGATMWYHDHALGITRLNVYMGLAGFYLLRDGVEDALDLPEGEFEVPLAIQDRSFNPDGSLRYHTDRWREHFFGDFILVNGKVWPFLNVKRGKYRFRLLNASGSRSYTLALSDSVAFLVIGTDGGLLQEPLSVQSLTISPGERADIVIDFAGYSAGAQVVLTNSAVAPFPNGPVESIIPEVMKFIVTAPMGHTAPIPAALSSVPAIPASESIRQRNLELVKLPAHANCPDHTDGVWMINGLMWDDLTEFPLIGTTETWAWINRSDIVHPMHMHLVSFQVLNRQAFVVFGENVTAVGPLLPPSPSETGWKDTVQSPPGLITRVITRFDGAPGLYPYHCHMLEHEDHEMMRQFRLICPGDFDRSGVVNVPDIFAFLSAWFAGDPRADFNNNGTVFTPDIFAFLSAWFASCP